MSSSLQQQVQETVLVLGIQRRESLSVMRSLHNAGYRIIATRMGEAQYTESSNCCDQVIDFPSFEHKDEWLSVLQKLAEVDPQIKWIFPVGDQEILFLESVQEHIPKRLNCVMPSKEIIRLCRQKDELLPILSECNIPCGQHGRARHGIELRETIEAVGLPCVVKPSTDLIQFMGQKAVILKTPAEVDHFLWSLPGGEAFDVIVQSYVSGPRHNLYFTAAQGELLQAVQVKILRTDRMDGTGYAVEGVSVPISATLLAHSSRLVKRLKYHGVGCMQYIVNGEEELFLEINSRIGANSIITSSCGLPLPLRYLQLTQDSSGGSINHTETLEYATHRYCWLTGDLHGLKEAIQNGDAGFGSACQWIGRMIWSACRSDTHIIFDRTDPRPAFSVLFKKFRKQMHVRHNTQKNLTNTKTSINQKQQMSETQERESSPC